MSGIHPATERASERERTLIIAILATRPSPRGWCANEILLDSNSAVRILVFHAFFGKASYLTGWLAVADRLVHSLHRIDDVLAMWDVARARDAAWTNGRALWTLGDEPALKSEFVLVLERMVGFASRGLLIPADSLLQKLARLLRSDLGLTRLSG